MPMQRDDCDDDQERRGRVEAMRPTLRATKNASGNAGLRSKTRNSRYGVGAKR
jgi:hypothetical protein